jgi:hypothetical protein
MIAIPTSKDAGDEVPKVTGFEETGDVDVVLPEKPPKKEIEPEVISVEDPSSPDTIYVDTKLAEESLPEDQRVRYADDGGSPVPSGSDDGVPAGDSVPEEEVEDLAQEIDEADTVGRFSPKSDDERYSTEWAFQGLRRA